MSLQPTIFDTPEEMGRAAAQLAGETLRAAVAERGFARIIVATGASQFTVLDHLTREEVNWSLVDGFHLDEYIGVPIDHPASFCGYLKERFVDKVPLRSFRYLDGTADPKEVCRAAGVSLTEQPIDLAMVGIGENGHLAFNDPPADFNATDPYLIVELDQECRQQQVGEGWFKSLEDVPTQAISMSVPQIMKSKQIICSVPDERKAKAVKESVRGPVTPQVPASILQRHDDVHLMIDKAAASLL